MAEVAETVAADLPGVNYKLVSVTATLGSASDTIVLTQAETGIQSIAGVVGAVITGGADAAFTWLQVAASSMTLTVVSFEQDGTPSTEWTGTTVAITVIGTM